jgi:hypothetical protein
MRPQFNSATTPTQPTLSICTYQWSTPKSGVLTMPLSRNTGCVASVFTDTLGVELCRWVQPHCDHSEPCGKTAGPASLIQA